MSADAYVHDLHRVFYNAIQFSRKDSLIGPGVMLRLMDNELEVSSSDDYVSIHDTVPVFGAQGVDSRGWVSLEDAKALEKQLRDEKEDEAFPLDSIPTTYRPTTDQKTIWEQLEIFGLESQDEDSREELAYDFAILPDRLTKLSRLKPGGYPIDIRKVEVEDKRLLAFKCGPTLTGLIAPLNREIWMEQDDYRGCFWPDPIPF